MNTAKSYLVGSAPKRITLYGDKSRKAESAEHIIEFPGGAIELARCSDGTYWAHILVNRGGVIDDSDGIDGAVGQVIDSRIDYNRPPGDIREIADHAGIRQISIRIAVTP